MAIFVMDKDRNFPRTVDRDTSATTNALRPRFLLGVPVDRVEASRVVPKACVPAARKAGRRPEISVVAQTTKPTYPRIR